MNEIDWSKAPEGTIGHGNIGISNFHVWFSDKWYEYVNSNHGGRHYFGDTCVYKEKDIVSCTPRPTTPSWSGEGVPPVGTVCEARCGRLQWSRCVVFAHKPNTNRGVDVLFDIDGDWTFLDDASMFRPIRTPEQIAADEREAAIDEMLAATPAPGSDISLRVCEKLYDAGYRKP